MACFFDIYNVCFVYHLVSQARKATRFKEIIEPAPIIEVKAEASEASQRINWLAPRRIPGNDIPLDKCKWKTNSAAQVSFLFLAYSIFFQRLHWLHWHLGFPPNTSCKTQQPQFFLGSVSTQGAHSAFTSSVLNKKTQASTRTSKMKERNTCSPIPFDSIQLRQPFGRTFLYIIFLYLYISISFPDELSVFCPYIFFRSAQWQKALFRALSEAKW